MNGILGTYNYGDSAVIDTTHPPILGTAKAKANNGTLAEGLIVAKDTNGDLVAYDPAGAGATASLAVIKGVLVHDCDTTKDDAAVIIKHGTVSQAKLLVGAAVPNAANLAALEAFGIFAL